MTTTNKQTIIDRLLKVKELAVRGVDGEQTTAKKLLEETMRKYGITDKELSGGEDRIHYYTTFSPEEYNLLWWLFQRVWYEHHTESYTNYYGIAIGNDQVTGYLLSPVEHAELAALYEHHRAALNRSLQKLEQDYRDQLQDIKADLAARKKAYHAYIQRRTDERKKIRADYKKAKGIMGAAYIAKNRIHINNKPQEPTKPKKQTARGKANGDLDGLILAYATAERVGDPNQLPALRIGEEEP